MRRVIPKAYGYLRKAGSNSNNSSIRNTAVSFTAVVTVISLTCLLFVLPPSAADMPVLDAGGLHGMVPTAYAQVPDECSSTDFVTTWRTTGPDESIQIPVGGATGNYTVNWGDGIIENDSGNQNHTYAEAGDYKVCISGDFTRIHINYDRTNNNHNKIISIDQWGNMT